MVWRMCSLVSYDPGALYNEGGISLNFLFSDFLGDCSEPIQDRRVTDPALSREGYFDREALSAPRFLSLRFQLVLKPNPAKINQLGNLVKVLGNETSLR